jgi:uncharacterized surface anchored protein
METAVPDHYVNSGVSQTFNAYEDGKTYEFTVTNAPNKGGIRLTKTDSETGAFLAGVQFSIYQGDTLIATMTTDENGVASFFLEENDYKVGFTVMPAGYVYAGDEQEWYFADGENTMTVVINKIA